MSEAAPARREKAPEDPVSRCFCCGQADCRNGEKAHGAHVQFFPDDRRMKLSGAGAMKYTIRMEELTMLFVQYPKCTTCQRAKKYLDGRGAAYESRHIAEENPSIEELKEWHKKSGLPLKKFFNTSGIKYKEQQLKDKLPGMSEEEQFALLASDGMLVKRPILVGDDFVLVGFKEADWEEKLKK